LDNIDLIGSGFARRTLKRKINSTKETEPYKIWRPLEKVGGEGLWFLPASLWGNE
jgi:hypothetical protein